MKGFDSRLKIVFIRYIQDINPNFKAQQKYKISCYDYTT